MPAWHLFSALLVFWLVVLQKLIKFFPLSLFPSFCLNFSNFLFPKVIGEISVVEGIILGDLNNSFNKLSLPNVPLKYCIPGKFFQKAAALLSAPAFGDSTAVADIVVNRFWSMWNQCEGMCLVGFIEGVANKRYVGLPTSLGGVGIDCHG